MVKILPIKAASRDKGLAVSLIAVALAACGGGGGGVEPLPPPPVTPPPSPPPPSPPPGTPGIISAPARASTAAGAAPAVNATAGGPNFTTGVTPGTVFPTLQTMLVIDANGISADPEGNAAGSNMTVANGKLTVGPIHTHAALNGTFGFSGEPWSGYESLDWARVGYWSTGGVWDEFEDRIRHRGVFVAGYETPLAAMPISGTATYTGKAQAAVYMPLARGSGAMLCNCEETWVTGNASFTADFGARNLAGSLTDMTAPHPWYDGEFVAWNGVAFNAAITGNGFSGTTIITNPNSGWASLGPNATGTVEGKFFGPAAQEAGAVWTLFDGTRAAIGTLTGKRP